MQLFPFIFSLSFFTATVLLANGDVATSLLEDMSETAKIATQTNQNIDYQPFILSVLQSDDLMKFGVRTLGEALILVPGVDMATNTMNNRTPIFRGSNPTSYGQSTLVIDGFVINDSMFSNYNSYLDYPIELIDRIEIVRGSGSFIEGVNGYAGTINVITHAQRESRSDQNSMVFAHAGSNGTIGLGGLSQYQGDKWKLSLDAFTQHHDNQTPILVTDTAISPNLPQTGYAQLGMKQNSFGINYKYDRLELSGRYNGYKNDSAFGNLNALPNQEGVFGSPSWYLQGKYSLPLATDLTLVFKTSMMENTLSSDSRALPVGKYGPVTFSDGYWASIMVKTRQTNGAASLHYDGLKSQHVIIGSELTRDEAVDMYSITTNKSTGTGLVDYTSLINPSTGLPLAFVDAEHSKRETANLFLTDNITINNYTALAFTLGTMITSDIGSHPYGRASIVYQPTHNDIFKIMTAYGVRFPSFQEMYATPSPYATGNRNLSAESVRSLEAQYLRKLNPDLTAGINFFYLSNSKQIVRDTHNVFQNYGQNNIRGGEAELRGKFTTSDTVTLSYSYIYGEVTDKTGNNFSLPYAASDLIKMAYAHDFTNDWTLGGIWNYVGSKKRHVGDIRDDLKAYNTLDVSLGWNMETRKGWYAQGGIKDIGNTIVRYPATANTYAGDYPIAERNFWIRAGWRF